MKLQLFKPQQQPKASVRVGVSQTRDEQGKDAAFIEKQFGLLKKRHIAPPVRLLKL